MTRATQRLLRDAPRLWETQRISLLSPLNPEAWASRPIMIASKQKYAGLLTADDFTRRRLALALRQDVSWNVFRADLRTLMDETIQGANEVREVGYVAAGAVLEGMRKAMSPAGVDFNLKITKSELDGLRGQAIAGFRMDHFIRRVFRDLPEKILQDTFVAFTGPTAGKGDVLTTVRGRVEKRMETAQKQLEMIIDDFTFMAMRGFTPQFAEPTVKEI